MKEKPLSYEQFEQAKLIVNSKHSDDDEMMNYARMPYSQYLISRWKMKQGSAVCAIDPIHHVMEYAYDCKVSINHTTFEQIVEDQNGDSVYECQECLGLKKQFVTYETYIEDFEALVQPTEAASA